MARNVEIKARVDDPVAFERRVRRLCGGQCCRVRQEDTFFHVPRGRLKLRVTGPGPAELISYERPDRPEPKACTYEVVRIATPAAARRALSRVLGVRGTVRKTRRVFMCGSTRVHLDHVDGLGDFVELEVVLGRRQTPAYGRRVASAILKRLGIGERDLVDRAYIDLQEMRKGGERC